ncbi:MAG: ribosome-associated translation inhibitor RaiA [Saprospiraceae bacterium]|jgi:putative sigma-54 modulation protein|nr:ribosome-associated translation inhibitor RaiA [Saprospiraceae bacterium]MBL0293348.1 ribosome-associated translation inhibitor RaiA [Saprospiraceae bacterium]
MKINIESIHFDADQKLLDHVEAKANKLKQYFDRIIDVTVSMKMVNVGKIKEKYVEVRTKVPGNLLISKESDKTFEIAAEKAFDIMKRNVVKHKNLVTQH